MTSQIPSDPSQIPKYPFQKKQIPNTQVQHIRSLKGALSHASLFLGIVLYTALGAKVPLYSLCFLLYVSNLWEEVVHQIYFRDKGLFDQSSCVYLIKAVNQNYLLCVGSDRQFCTIILAMGHGVNFHLIQTTRDYLKMQWAKVHLWGEPGQGIDF